MDESKFCTGCGKPIEPGMQFCPQCGVVVSGSAADEQFKENEKEIRGILIQSRRNWLIFFLAIYAIPVIIAAIIALVDASSSANAIWENASFQKWLSEHHISMTVGDIQNYITGAATMALLSGMFRSSDPVRLVHLRNHHRIPCRMDDHYFQGRLRRLA